MSISETGTDLYQIPQYHITVRLQHGKCHEENKIIAVIVRPKNFPETKHVFEREFSFECDKNPPMDGSRLGLKATVTIQLYVPEAEK